MFDAYFCIDSAGGIGLHGSIPWNVKEDLQFFVESTRDKVIIMGHKTWNSLPQKPLKKRLNLVVSRHFQGEKEGALWTHTFQEAYDRALLESKEIAFIGGATLFKSVKSHPKMRSLFLTVLEKSFGCDVFLEYKDLFHLEKVLRDSRVDAGSGIGYRIEEWRK